jgi:hypothetical protein
MAEATLITIDDDCEEFLQDHLTHFFNTISYDIIHCFSQEDKERYFKLVTDHESLITKLYEEAVLNSIIFLPVALRNNIDNELIQQYKAWLEKQ